MKWFATIPPALVSLGAAPDCNEDGNITSADRSAVTALIGAGAVCPTP